MDASGSENSFTLTHYITTQKGKLNYHPGQCQKGTNKIQLSMLKNTNQT